jgi:hypothetical protein
MVMDIGNLLSGGLLGSLTGLLGSGVTAYVAYKNKKLDIEDRKDERKHRITEIDTEAKHALTMEKVRIEDRTDERDASAMEKAMDMIKGQLFKQEYASYLPRWVMAIIAFLFAMVDIMRAVVRPGGTMYLLYVMSAITYGVYETDPARFYTSVIDPWAVIAYMGSTAFMWWFGDRRLAKVMATRLSA